MINCLNLQIQTCPAWNDDVVSAAVHVAVLDIVDVQHEIGRRDVPGDAERKHVPSHLMLQAWTSKAFLSFFVRLTHFMEQIRAGWKVILKVPGSKKTWTDENYII